MPIGTYEGDSFTSHNHGISDPFSGGPGTGEYGNGGGSQSGISIQLNANNFGQMVTTFVGGNETRGKSTIANIFIRIN